MVSQWFFSFQTVFNMAAKNLNGIKLRRDRGAGQAKICLDQIIYCYHNSLNNFFFFFCERLDEKICVFRRFYGLPMTPFFKLFKLVFGKEREGRRRRQSRRRHCFRRYYFLVPLYITERSLGAWGWGWGWAVDTNFFSSSSLGRKEFSKKFSFLKRKLMHGVYIYFSSSFSFPFISFFYSNFFYFIVNLLLWLKILMHT